MIRRLKLYYIDDKYIDFLRKYDSRVAYNKNGTRPYVGVVYQCNEMTYFAPLSSPKPKHLTMNKNMVDIWKIEDGKLGVVNFNNMIPCFMSVLTEAIPKIQDIKYKKLLENQISSINANRDQLLHKVILFRKKYDNKFLGENVLKRCCDFKLLEEKCHLYQSNTNN